MKRSAAAQRPPEPELHYYNIYPNTGMSPKAAALMVIPL